MELPSLPLARASLPTGEKTRGQREISERDTQMRGRRPGDSTEHAFAHFLSLGERIKVRAKDEYSASSEPAKKTHRGGKTLVVPIAQPNVANLKFRRQHPLGDRIVDFFCAEAKLAIELDGSGHASYRGQTSDLDREIELYEKGIRVLRFQNTDVFNNLDGVLNTIIYAVDAERSLWP